MTQDNANHDAVPAARAPADSHAPRGAVDRESVGTDKAEPLTRDCGTGNTTDRPQPVKDSDFDRSKPIRDARLAALEELAALDQKLELEYGLTGNPLIKAQGHMRSPNCCYCEKPHGKSFPLIFQSCDACQDARDKREADASNGLMSVSCPRCDLQFSADAVHLITDEEREAVDAAQNHIDGYDGEWGDKIAATLRGLLERLGGGR